MTPDKKIIQLYNQHKEKILYVFFGGLTTLINYIVYFSCKFLLNMPTTTANVIAWAVAVLWAFFTNKHFVFGSKNNGFRKSFKEFIQFVGGRVSTLVLDGGIMVIGIDVLGINDFIIKTLANILVFIVNYILSKFIVFKNREAVMNETIKYILERRSIRKYKADEVPKEMLDAVIEAGLYAPSSMNKQPWHITVLENKEIIDEITKEVKKELLESATAPEGIVNRAKSPDFSIFYDAPTVLIVSGDSTSRYLQGDTSNVMENMCIAAQSLGLATCYNALFLRAFNDGNREDLYKKLGIPNGYEPVSATSIGYPGMPNPPAAPRKEKAVNYVK